ncbi:unnamed protein product [Allacma fusca]|uniref:Uncharacterized protein n=1 Tax=Allacma fusca TaxID=39272 RepID=A0A8J2K0L5_9HEXA|nr:unnamed protein product [Allacma fusca]
MANQIHIRAPPTNPDDPVEAFQSNLVESIGLLQQYNQYLERQKAIEIKLDQSKDATITALIKNLVERRKEQDALRKCIGILFKVKSEFEEVKRRVFEKTLEDSKALLTDQATQCELSAGLHLKLTSVGTSTNDVYEGVSKQWTAQSEDTIMGVKETDEAHLGAAIYSKKGSIENEGRSCEEAGASWNNSTSSKRKDDSRLKTVRFCADVENPVFPVINDNGNSQRRVPLQTTPINIFNQIIPVRALESVLPDISKFEAAGAPSTKGTNSSIRETLIAKVKSSSSGKLSRLDLKKIYGFDTFRCVKRPISGDQGSSTSTGSHKSPEKCASGLDTSSQQYPNLARTVLNEKSNTISTIFQKRLSSCTKQPRKVSCKSSGRKKDCENKKKREKPDEIRNGKRLIQTVLHYEVEPINEIDEFSTSTSDMESMIHEDSLLAGEESTVVGIECCTSGIEAPQSAD